MSINELMDKKDHIYNGIIYNGILLNHKKDKILPLATTQMDLEGIVLSESSQVVKDKYHIISLISRIWNKIKLTNKTETKSQMQQ